jgi:hypothetical protein
MKFASNKISLRGSLAGDIAKRMSKSAQRPNLSMILHELLKANADDIICIPEGGMLKVGRKSELGMFPPDW